MIPSKNEGLGKVKKGRVIWVSLGGLLGVARWLCWATRTEGMELHIPILFISSVYQVRSEH